MAFQSDAFQLDAFQIDTSIGPVSITVELIGINVLVQVSPVITVDVTTESSVTIEVTPMARLFFGQRTSIKATFLDDGVAFDPAAVKLTLMLPDGSVLADPDGVTNPSTGVYEYALLLNQTGQYRYRWESTGSNEEAAQEGSFVVPVPLTA